MSDSPVPFRALLATVLVSLACVMPARGDFVAFESGQTRPLALSADGERLFAVNTPDNRLEVFQVGDGGLAHLESVPVGLEPVAVALRANGDAWVVNHLSDSVSIVGATPDGRRVVQTLHTGDEPSDIAFAGPDRSRAFITSAHRGQNSPYPRGQYDQPGIGRADVWVFDADAPGDALGGSPITILSLFGDKPRSIVASADGTEVYVSVFRSGNRTTVLNEGSVCDGGITAGTCSVFGVLSPGGLPAPNDSVELTGLAPETGLILEFDPDAGPAGLWVDELGRNWSAHVRFSLPDLDVFAVDAMAPVPAETGSWSGVGTILFDLAVNPASGRIYVSNTEANNRVRFEGKGLFAGPFKPEGEPASVRGHLHEARVTVLDGPGVLPRHLNKHIDYSAVPVPAGVRERSLATPTAMAVDAAGETLYVAAFGSSKIGVFDTAELESDSFVPDAQAQIALTGGGPSGLVIDEARDRLYVLTRFDNSVSVIDLASNSETQRRALHNPEPAAVVAGRPFLYDATLTSGNGEASCSSCHVFGDMDDLAWDLGDPDGLVENNLNPFALGSPPPNPIFHPMKGPMTTQSLRGMADHGPMHWRGDRTAATTGGDHSDEEAAFKAFNPAFDGLLGRDEGQLTEEQMQAFTDFVLTLRYPPSPIRKLDDSLRVDEARGLDAYMQDPGPDTATSCNGCHTLDPENGFFGSDGDMSIEVEPQEFKVPHLRNAYQKVGMFGMAAVPFFVPGDNGHKGDQVRGFGFLHDGSTDTLLRFFNAFVFRDGFDNFFPFPEISKRDLEALVLAFDTGLAPIVGQQVTLSPANAGQPEVQARIDLMIAQAALGRADLVATWSDGGPRAALLVNGNFERDQAGAAALTPEQLAAIGALPEQAVTYTAVPPATGQRIGLDRDRDGVLNGDDLCPSVADPLQIDSDADGLGDACDNCRLAANADQRDTNADGFGNLCDADLDGDGTVAFGDVALMKAAFLETGDNLDADLDGDGAVNFGDLALMKQSFLQPPGPGPDN